MSDVSIRTGIDNNGVRRGLAETERLIKAGATRAGVQFAKSFNGQINRYLQVGAILSIGASLTKLGKEARQVQLESLTRGISVERLQAIKKLSDELGASFSSLPIEQQIEFADRLLDTGEVSIKTSEDIQNLAASYANLERASVSLADTTVSMFSAIANGWRATQETIARMIFYNTAIVRHRADFEKVLEDLREYDKSPSRDSSLGVITRIARDIGALPPREAAERIARTPATRGASLPSAPSIASDQLQRIGLFVGGAGNPAIVVAREQLTVLRQQLEVQRRTLQGINSL
jgi:hypothetical protein